MLQFSWCKFLKGKNHIKHIIICYKVTLSKISHELSRKILVVVKMAWTSREPVDPSGRNTTDS